MAGLFHHSLTWAAVSSHSPQHCVSVSLWRRHQDVNIFREGKGCQCKFAETGWCERSRRNDTVSVAVQHCWTKARSSQQPLKKSMKCSRGSNQVVGIFSGIGEYLNKFLKHLAYNRSLTIVRAGDWKVTQC